MNNVHKISSYHIKTIHFSFQFKSYFQKSINEPSLGEYDVANVIDTATFTIARIIERFPPCWLAANKEYRTFLQAKEKHLISGKGTLVDFLKSLTCNLGICILI